MTTFSALIEETMRRLVPAQLDLTVGLPNAIGELDQSFVLTDNPVRPCLQPGEYIAIDFEVMYILGWDASTSTVTVSRGAQGSTAAFHLQDSIVYVNPKFTRFEATVAINQELNSLSGAGLYQVKTADIPYIPPYMGYDLPHDPLLIDVIGVRYKVLPPTHNFPAVLHWRVLPMMTDPAFPSGMGIVFYNGGYPGLPIHVWYTAGFDALVYATDDATGVAGVPPTAVDIISAGASIIMVHEREIKRNFTEAQPDARKATEVPPAAVMNSTKGLEMWRANRIAEERGRLENQYKYLRSFR